MAYYPYVVLFHDICAFFLAIGLISFSVRVFYKKRYHSSTTSFFPLITVYFVYVFIAGSILLIQSIYTFFLWRPDSNIYNAYTLYYLGVAWNWILFSNSIIEILICIERIALILLPVKYHSKIITYSVYITLLAWATSLTIWSIINDWIEMSPKNSSTECLAFACLVPLSLGQNFFMFKLAFVFINIVACLTLLLLFKFYLYKTTNSGSKRFTKTLIIIISITSLTDLLPNILTGLGTMIFQIYLANYVGPYNTTLYAVTMTICSRLYSKAILNRDNHNNNNNNNNNNPVNPRRHHRSTVTVLSKDEQQHTKF